MPTNPELEPSVASALDEAIYALRRASSVAVACHIGPDGDALGSILALALALSRRGVRVVAGWGSEHVEVVNPYTFLPGVELVSPPEKFDGVDVFLAVDCASADRLGLLRDTFDAAVSRLNIDHHVSNTMFGSVNVVDPAAPSSSELVLWLLERMGVEIDVDIATNLYTGLITDTGRFGYASATPRAHAAASKLIECGVDVAEINQAVFESLPYGYLKTLGFVLERCELSNEPPLVVTWMTQADLAAGGVSMDETDGFIDVVRTTRETDVTAIIKELDSGEWKVSLRSKGATDVGSIATKLGGGGHTLASGYTSEFGLRGTIDQIKDELRALG